MSIGCVPVFLEQLLLKDSSEVLLLFRDPSWVANAQVDYPSIWSLFISWLTSSEMLSLSVRLEYLNEVLSVRAVEKLEAVVVIEFIEYLCCLDRGFSNISSLIWLPLSEQVKLRCLVLLSWKEFLCAQDFISIERCAWFCIVWIYGCVFFFLIRLLWVDILLIVYVFGSGRTSSDIVSIAFTFSWMEGGFPDFSSVVFYSSYFMVRSLFVSSEFD